jgi:hypothetical protein
MTTMEPFTTTVSSLRSLSDSHGEQAASTKHTPTLESVLWFFGVASFTRETSSRNRLLTVQRTIHTTGTRSRVMGDANVYKAL